MIKTTYLSLFLVTKGSIMNSKLYLKTIRRENNRAVLCPA